VYTLLKASDFIVHDLSAESVFEGCVNNNDNDNDNDEDHEDHDQGTRCESAEEGYKLELVLRKWFAIDPSREMRAFVRDGVLIGAYITFHSSFCRYDVYVAHSRAPWRKIRTNERTNETGNATQ
jgi:D123